MTTTPRKIGNWIAPARFIGFILLFPIAGLTASRFLDFRIGWMIGFDLAAIVFLVSCFMLFRHGGADEMRQHARENDANRTVLLVVTVAVSLAVMATIGAEVMQTLAPPLTAADRAVRAGRWLRRHPAWLVAPAVALLVWRPAWLTGGAGAAGLLRWAGRAIWLWQWWGRLQPLLTAARAASPAANPASGLAGRSCARALSTPAPSLDTTPSKKFCWPTNAATYADVGRA